MSKPYVVALEEHYWDRELATYFKGADGTRSNRIRERLDDVGALRLQEMDEAGKLAVTVRADPDQAARIRAKF